MRDFHLNIADYHLRFEAAEPSTELVLSEKFTNFPDKEITPGVTVRVHAGTFKPQQQARRVFHAPYIIETGDKKHKVNDKFWSVWQQGKEILIETILPLGSPGRKAWLKTGTENEAWDLYVDGPGNRIDPLEYPLDGLLLYYLTVMTGDIFIHGSGVSMNNKGYFFTGASGKGKTTIARLWEEAGATVIHDDRLITRNKKEGFVMYNTPVYNDESPRSSPVDKIFIIDHGTTNKLVPLQNSEALSLVMANCIQHLWDPSIIVSLTETLHQLTSQKSVYRLYFSPDKSVVPFILMNDNQRNHT
jgi:hypothetical protein